MPTPESNFEYDKSLKTVQSYAFIHKYLPVHRYVLRPPAGLIAKALFQTGVTPNNLTFISFLLAMTSAACYLGGSHPWFAAGGVLALPSGIFDCADGMLARAKNLCSHYGAYLDLYLDRIGDFCFPMERSRAWGAGFSSMVRLKNLPVTPASSGAADR